ncbi:hypothetical protein PIB30_079302 [Stylosanthes scabra]|uniref:FAR1 domain-containing protein n=1 Tax=Stylosanthes scabra TaxID=79078 RepID=A0ABU6WQW7_9FABA|nr:hypothetical protein [Stylosanthes scabra]
MKVEGGRNALTVTRSDGDASIRQQRQHGYNDDDRMDASTATTTPSMDSRGGASIRRAMMASIGMRGMTMVRGWFVHMDPVNIVSVNEEVENEETSTVDAWKIPNASMVFNSEEELCNYYRKYAFNIGFEVRKNSTRNDSGKKYYSLGCAKGGKNVPKKESIVRRLLSKTNCKAKITVVV